MSFSALCFGQNRFDLYDSRTSVLAPLGCLLGKNCAIPFENCASTEANEEKVAYNTVT